jgi:uncharacterized membrane protein YfcA
MVTFILAFGAFTQSVTGFGAGLVTMAFLPAILGIRTAAPVVALMNLTSEIFLLLRYRHSLQIGTVWPMIVASLLMIPLGVYALGNLDEKLVTRILGIVMAGFALWALLGIRLPALKHPAWGVLADGLGGILGGAYNTSGPPVIIYGNCRRWSRDVFKANLTGYFILNSILICANHAWSDNFEPPVITYFLVSLPAIGLAIWLGFRLDRRINPVLFRKIVLILLLGMGVWMLF